MKKVVQCVLVGLIATQFAACTTYREMFGDHNKAQSLSSDQGGADAHGVAGYGMGGSSTRAYQQAATFAVNNKCIAAKNLPGIEQHYFFGFDKYSVSPQFYTSLRTQANYLMNHPKVKVRIVGNTDDRGSREYNVGLGWRRARAIAQALQQQGVSKKQLIVVSYGAEKPAAFGHTAADYQCNRRSDLVYRSLA